MRCIFLLLPFLLTACDLPIDTEFARAVAAGDFEKAEDLLDRGARIDVRHFAEDGRTLLMAAAAAPAGNETLRFLVRHGANPDVQDRNGGTALMHAVRHGQEENARLLLEAGADPSISDALGETAMSIAKERGLAKIVRLLEGAQRDT